MQGLRLDLRFYCFSCPSASPCLPLDSFLCRDWLQTEAHRRFSPDLHLFPVATATRRGCTCVSSLCSSCLLVAVAFCVAEPVWIYLLCSIICRAFSVCQRCLAQSAERKALNLKIEDSSTPWSTGGFVSVRLLRQSCGCLPCLSLAQRSTSCSLLLLLL